MVGKQFLRIFESSDYYPPFSGKKVCQDQGEAGVLTEALSTYLTPALPSDDGTKFWQSENFSAGVAIAPWAQHLQSSCLPLRWLIDISTLCLSTLLTLQLPASLLYSLPTFPSPILPTLYQSDVYSSSDSETFICFIGCLTIAFLLLSQCLFFFPTTPVRRVVWISGHCLKFLYLYSRIITNQQAATPGH